MQKAFLWMLLSLAFAMPALSQEPAFKFEAMKRHDEPEFDFKFMQQAPDDAPEAVSSEDPGPQLSFRFLGVAEDAKPDDKPDCPDARQINRVLVIYHEKTTTETVREKVCDAYGCRFVNRIIQHKPEASSKVLAELKKLEPKWITGDKACCHFRLINADDPVNANLVKELDVKRSDMPILIKETDPGKRKKAHDMSGDDMAKWWNKQFLEPKADPISTKPVIAEVPQCVPGAGSFSNSSHWTYNGSKSMRDHITDPRSEHHLPKEVVNGIGPNKVGRWSDAQVQAWHNWHHEAMQGKAPAATKAPSPARAVQPTRSGAVWQSVAPKLRYASGSREEQIAYRITQIVSQSVKSGPPARTMAQAGSSKKNRTVC